MFLNSDFYLFFLHLGHGGSDGLHGYVHSLDDVVSDTVCFQTVFYKCFDNV